MDDGLDAATGLRDRCSILDACGDDLDRAASRWRRSHRLFVENHDLVTALNQVWNQSLAYAAATTRQQDAHLTS